ncbi:MAG: hypothetical protein WB716_09575 [Candidatus Acidiferrales bacterium]
MPSLRKLLQRAPFYGAYKALGHYPDYWYWHLRGRPARSPHLLKQRTVLEYAARYDLHVLVETGTYYGEMISAVKGHFDYIYSIEFDPQLARRATERFAHDANIWILQGDSQALLPGTLKSVAQPALFWLDAGYHGWDGVEGKKHRLSGELEAILRHPVAGHVILMDDARCLGAFDRALTVDNLKSRIVSAFPGHRVEVLYDILRITPGP